MALPSALALVCVGLLTVLASSKRQVFVFRHCVRSTGRDDRFADYTAYKMPDWGVPPMWCTARGMDIMRRTGAELVTTFGVDATKTRFTADLSMRDEDTATAVVEGMGLRSADMKLDSAIFHSRRFAKTPCKMPNKSVWMNERDARLEQVRVPEDLETALLELQGIIGVGKAGSLVESARADGGVVVNRHDKPIGPADVLAYFSQVLLFSWASNVYFGGLANATQEQIQRLISWQFWYQSVAWMNAYLVDDDGVLLLADILNKLNEPGEGTDMYFGHDSTLVAIAAVLNVTWSAPPYSGGDLLPTLPGSALLFEHDTEKDIVSVRYVYHVFDPKKRGR